MFTVERGMISQAEFLTKLENYPIVVTNKKKGYYNIPAAFDIETSSFLLDGEKRGCMYIWMFGINNLVTYGRTWPEFIKFLHVLSTVLEISDDRRLVVYVHNLPFEFQWLRKWLKWDEVFLLDERKPSYARANGIEFRCSLKLSGGKSLENVGKDLQNYKVEKAVGLLDYSKIRTSITPLSKEELLYCENDIRVLLAYIQEKIETDGDITRIPMTNTGYVRNFCRKECYKRWKRYRSIISELTLDADEYSQLKRAFQGGFTHANAHYVKRILNKVASYDFTSSYPAVMLLEKFPMSKAKKIETAVDGKEMKYYLQNYCCMFDLELFDVIPKLHQDHPISASKCWELENYTEDNGRIVAASHLKTTITEQDFAIYKEFYSWTKLTISNLRIYEKGYLPTQFVKALIYLYEGKTKLKDVEGEEVNYMILKNMLNAAYGMIVTDIVRDEISYEDDNFITDVADVDEAIEKYNKNVRRFLFYPWGVWVTAYARANLFSGIIACGGDYVYSDTDSVKVLNVDRHQDYFDRYNEQVFEKIERAAKYHGLSPTKFSPLNKKGKTKTIGVWDFEGTYDEFKTLGAKRYLTRSEDSYRLTVAGANKKLGCEYLQLTGQPFENFKDGLVIPSKYAKRLSMSYIDEPTAGTIIDYLGQPYEFYEKSSLHMEATEYSLSLSKMFIDYLKGVADISE